MLTSITVRQTSEYVPVADALKNTTDALIKGGCKVVNVIETKVNKVPGLTDQGFIVVYEIPENEEKEIIFAREKENVKIFDRNKLETRELYDVVLMQDNDLIAHHKYARFSDTSWDATEITFILENVDGANIGRLEVSTRHFSEIQISRVGIGTPINIIGERTMYEWVEDTFKAGKPYHIRRIQDGKETENYIGLYRRTNAEKIIFTIVTSEGRAGEFYVWLEVADEYKITEISLNGEEEKKDE